MSNTVPARHQGGLPQAPYWAAPANFFSDPWFPFGQLEAETFKLDMKEDEDSYIIEADLPGVKKKDVGLSLACGYLTISVDRKEVAEDDKKTLHKERRYSHMERSIFLADATENGARAKLQNGELTITIPKQRKGTSKQAIAIE